MLQSFSIQVSAGQQGGGSKEQGRAGVPTLIKTLPTVLAASSTMRYNTPLVTGVRGHCPRVPAGGGRGSGNSGWRPNTGSPGSSSQFRSPILLSCNKVRRMGNGSSSWTQEMFIPNSQRGDVWVVNDHFFLVEHSGTASPPGSSAHGSAAHDESTCATKFRPNRRFGPNANETRTWVLFNWKRRREERQWLVIVCSQCGLGGCWLQVVPWVDGHTCAAGRQS